MVEKTAKAESDQVIGVLIDLSDGDHTDHAIKFVAHRRYDKLLCEHVYMGHCADCSQHKCTRRRF
jgi:hypothetical protein